MSDHKHGEMNIEVQEKTFEGFVNWVKWGVIVSLGILIFLAIFNS